MEKRARGSALRYNYSCYLRRPKASTNQHRATCSIEGRTRFPHGNRPSKKTHTPPAMPPASSDLAMDDAESVLWFLACSSVAVKDSDVLVAASAVGDDGAAMLAKKKEEGRKRERRGRKRKERSKRSEMRERKKNDVLVHSSFVNPSFFSLLSRTRLPAVIHHFLHFFKGSRATGIFSPIERSRSKK